jgi:hypothetical protein
LQYVGVCRRYCTADRAQHEITAQQEKKRQERKQQPLPFPMLDLDNFFYPPKR